MAEQANKTKPSRFAEPPGGGRQDHDAMRAASMLPLAGPVDNDTQAASGGLELPGRERHVVEVETAAPCPEPIPGERDPANLTHREPGTFGGKFAGADTPPPSRSAWLDDATAFEDAWEGGGNVPGHGKRDDDVTP